MFRTTTVQHLMATGFYHLSLRSATLVKTFGVQVVR